MAVNRVDFGGNTLIDLTGDTLELPEQLLKGIIAHCKDGTPIYGTLEAGGDSGGGIDITAFGFSKAAFGITVGSQSVIHNLGEYPKCVIFWSPDAWTYGDSISYPQYYLKAGIGFVLTDPSGNTQVVEGFSEIRQIASGGNKFTSWQPPNNSLGRSGFNSTYYPDGSNTGVCINAPNINSVSIDGYSGSGYKIRLYPGATYYWGVFA